MPATKLTYFDHAASTPMDPRVFAAMKPYFEDDFANPPGLYASARSARHDFEQARAMVANQLGAKPREIIFTAGATESNNLAIMGVARNYPGSRLVSTAIEHHAVLTCLDALQQEGHQTSIVPVPKSGIIDVDSVVSAIDDSTVLVSVMYANNEIGTIQPIAKIAKAIALIRSDRAKRGLSLPLYLHTDACQAANYLDLHVTRLGVDLMTLNASKMYGPKQVACLYVRTGIELKPLLYGGGQERGLRSGTENVAGAVGLATALELTAELRHAEVERLRGLRDYAIAKLLDLPGVTLNGDPVKRLPNNINVSIDGVDGEDLVLYLNHAGFAVSTGSACTASQEDPSHVLLALGLSRSQAEASLRLTFGRITTQDQIDEFLSVLPGIIAQLRATR